MNTYFGEVDYETDGDVFLFEDREFDFALEINEEEVVLRDASGRFVPMSYLSALELFEAVRKNYQNIRSLNDAKMVDFNTEDAI